MSLRYKSSKRSKRGKDKEDAPNDNVVQERTDSSASTQGSVSQTCYKEGHLLKWANYMKGFRERWFVLEHGVLAYYRTTKAGERTHKSSFVLAGSSVKTEPGNNFIIMPSRADRRVRKPLHLRAISAAERNSWIEAIEKAKTESDRKQRSLLSSSGYLNAVDFQGNQNDSDGESSSDDEGDLDPTENTVLSSKLEQVKKWHDSLTQRCEELISILQKDKEINQNASTELQGETSQVTQTATALLEASSNYLTEVLEQQKLWVSTLHMNERKRRKLEEQLEALARQHRTLEQSAGRVSRDISSGDMVDEVFLPPADSSDDEFFDAASAPSEEDDTTEGSDPSKVSEAAKANGTTIVRRTRVPPRKDSKISLWSVMKNSIGKDLSKISMPVNFNEPLSFTQRLCEDMEYSDLLDKAASSDNPLVRLAYVAAFSASAFASGASNRTGKPFNPLLGETYELDRRQEQGYRAVVEQVSHHPPICCMHCEGQSWLYWQECSFESKFRGKYLAVIPTGLSHVELPKFGDNFTFTKVMTTVHNIIVGKLWIDQSGTMVIKNHATGDECTLKYIPYSYFSSSQARRVEGTIKDKSGRTRFVLQGTWDKELWLCKPDPSGDKVLDKSSATKLWTRTPPFAGHEKMYGFTRMSCTLNEMTEIDKGCCPTDSRFRPDKNLMEHGHFSKANKVKERLENAQRARRRKMEASKTIWKPRWFEEKPDPVVKDRKIHTYKGGYWESKEKQDWQDTAQLYDVAMD
eukprot:m.88312 g.88312  ORF g.88312 m.88312 type:complete len:748 (+) comp13159_c0_seq2:213-2456(+)